MEGSDSHASEKSTISIDGGSAYVCACDQRRCGRYKRRRGQQ
ncbi:hypothetical protein [uncultured Ruminococcus sp.]|nr:hypothetical protein [uncultured Ruminococcus sp.]